MWHSLERLWRRFATLLSFGLFGGGSRDHGEYASLFAAAGLGGMRGETLGWGFTLFSLAPRRPQDEG